MIIRQWQGLGRKALLGGLLAWAGADALLAQPLDNGPVPAPQAVAQDAPPVRRNYMNRNVVDLPITMEDSARALIQEIHLYCKDHPGAPWVLRDKGAATQKAFRFQAPRDGEFWFTMVTLDRQGRSFPQDLQNEPPGLVVVIDTQKPAVEMSNAGQSPQGQLVHCDVRDANLDNARVRFFYQGGDKLFRPLDPIVGRPGIYCIPNQAVSTGVVRFVAEDLAGNQTVFEEHLNNMQARGTMNTATQQVGVNPLLNPAAKTPVDQKPNTLPAEVKLAPELDATDIRAPRMPGRINDPVKNVSYRPDGSDGPRFETKTEVTPPRAINTQVVEKPAPSPVAPIKRQIVNNTKVFLDFQIDVSAAKNNGSVEVWMTPDQGKSWRKVAEDPQRRSPIEVQLPGDGLFGLMLMVSNGRGPTAGPSANDAPDWWIEVDTMRPVAQITNLHVTYEKGQASVIIQWKAHDANLSQSPVDLFYAATTQGPWLPIAKGLGAQGQYRWTPPAEIGAQAHVRILARDISGNVGIVNTLEAVNLEDPSRPKILIRNIRTEPAAAPIIASPATPGMIQINQPNK